MKKFGSLVIAAIIGSTITLGAFQFLSKNDSKTFKIEHVNKTPAVSTAYSVNENGEAVPLDFTGTAEKVMPAVVHIRSTQTVSARNQSNPFHDFFGEDDFFERFFGPRMQPENRGPQARVGTGSGVIINDEGYIVTNNHVIEGADDIEVTLYDNRNFKATVIGTDPTTDLALIQVKENDLPTIPMANSDNVKVGEWVLAVGNPFNLTSTVTAGIISAKGRNLNILQNQWAVESFLQTDAAINPGNSGGALVNLSGGLIGINTAIASPTGAYSGYGFAVPTNIVTKVVEDLMKYGVVQRGVLGVTIATVNGDLVKEKDLKVYEGVYVDSVLANSAAKKAGLEEGDVITSINGNPVHSHPELMEMIARHRPGDKLDLTVNRFGKIREFEVTLKNREGESKLVAKESHEVLNILGADFEDLDKKTAKKLDLPGGIKVTNLTAGKLKRHTDIREGFIITKVDGVTVTSVEELIQALENKKGGVMLEGVYEDYPGEYYYAFGL